MRRLVWKVIRTDVWIWRQEAHRRAQANISFLLYTPLIQKIMNRFFISIFQNMRHSGQVLKKLVKIKRLVCLISAKNMRGGQNLPPPPPGRGLRQKTSLASYDLEWPGEAIGLKLCIGHREWLNIRISWDIWYAPTRTRMNGVRIFSFPYNGEVTKLTWPKVKIPRYRFCSSW